MAKVRTNPAPTRGWNAKDSFDSMREDEATQLDNWIPRAGYCVMRGGYSSYATTLGADVRTLAEFDDGTNVDFLAAANGNIWDISSSGAGSSLASGFSSDYWQTTTFNGNQGWVNGTDAPQTYNGSTIGAMTVSGLTVTDLVNISSYKSRTYFCENNSLSFWYSATNALGGALSEFLLNRVAQKGGYLMATGTWSRDAGDGPDDVFVAVTSKGEVLIYQGSDPGDVNDWALIGRYVTAPPIGRRCLLDLGGELIIITLDGYISINQIVNGERGQTSVSDRIRSQVISDAQSYSSVQGWEAVYYSRGGWVLFNVPLVVDKTYQQHILNVSDNPGAWCRFKGLQGRCWGVYNDRLYFGGDGVVYLADDGNADAGGNIEADGKTSYTYLRNRTNLKNFTGVRPLISSEGTISIGSGVSVDFGKYSGIVISTSTTVDVGKWNTGKWNSAKWGTGGQMTNFWFPANDLGYNISDRVLIRAQGQTVKWLSTAYMYDEGGIL